MGYEDAIRELGLLEGKLVLLQLRPVGATQSIFEMLDRVDRVQIEDADYASVTFSDAESSVSLRREDFVDATWEPGWRTGEYDENSFRLRLGAIDVGFLPS